MRERAKKRERDKLVRELLRDARWEFVQQEQQTTKKYQNVIISYSQMELNFHIVVWQMVAVGSPLSLSPNI